MLLFDLYDLIEKGWTQGPLAKDAEGEGCGPYAEEAVQFCLHGGALRLTQNNYSHELKLINDLRMVIESRNYVNFNEDPLTTKEMVLDFITKAIRFRILKTIRDKIAICKCSKAFARNDAGQSVGPTNPSACSWCILGAVMADPELAPEERILEEVWLVLYDVFDNCVEFSDKRSAKEVLDYVDEELALCVIR